MVAIIGNTFVITMLTIQAWLYGALKQIPWKARLAWAGLGCVVCCPFESCTTWKTLLLLLFFFYNLETHFLSTVVLKVILNWFSPIWFKHIPFVNLHVHILIVDIWLYLFQKFYIKCKKMWILREKVTFVTREFNSSFILILLVILY